MRKRLRAADTAKAGDVPEEEASSAFLRQQLHINVEAPRRCRRFYSPLFFRKWREERHKGAPQLRLP